jgi:hypothetical protein
LGIIGTITGTIAIIISYWAYRKERPNLKVELVDSSHNFNPSANGEHINFWLKCRVKNLGDRGTRINDIGVKFTLNNTEVILKAEEIRELLPSGNYKSGPKWLDAHDSVNILSSFYQPYRGERKETIDCTFMLFHTHGLYAFETTSVLAPFLS